MNENNNEHLNHKHELLENANQYTKSAYLRTTDPAILSENSHNLHFVPDNSHQELCSDNQSNKQKIYSILQHMARKIENGSNRT